MITEMNAATLEISELRNLIGVRSNDFHDWRKHHGLLCHIPDEGGDDPKLRARDVMAVAIAQKAVQAGFATGTAMLIANIADIDEGLLDESTWSVSVVDGDVAAGIDQTPGGIVVSFDLADVRHRVLRHFMQQAMAREFGLEAA